MTKAVALIVCSLFCVFVAASPVPKGRHVDSIRLIIRLIPLPEVGGDTSADARRVDTDWLIFPVEPVSIGKDARASRKDTDWLETVNPRLPDPEEGTGSLSKRAEVATPADASRKDNAWLIVSPEAP